MSNETLAIIVIGIPLCVIAAWLLAQIAYWNIKREGLAMDRDYLGGSFQTTPIVDHPAYRGCSHVVFEKCSGHDSTMLPVMREVTEFMGRELYHDEAEIVARHLNMAFNKMQGSRQ